MNWTTKDIPDLTGKVAIVTGGNSGFGFIVAKALTEKGAHVIIAARSQEKVQEAVTSLRKSFPNSKAEGMLVDLASMESLKRFVREFLTKDLPLHILVNNAGIFIVPFAKSPEKIEVTMAVNHFNTFYLTQLLLPKLKESAPSRVVFVNSGAAGHAPPVDWSDLTCEKAKDSGSTQYNISKLYNYMLGVGLAKDLKGSKVDVVIINPGLARTGIQGKGIGILPRIFWLLSFLIGQNAQQGASHIIFGATAPGLEGQGLATWGPKYDFFGRTSPWNLPHPAAKDAAQCDRMYKETAAIIDRLAASLA